MEGGGQGLSLKLHKVRLCRMAVVGRKNGVMTLWILSLLSVLRKKKCRECYQGQHHAT